MLSTPLPFPSPVEMLQILDPDIAAGRVKLYDWQEEALRKFAGQHDQHNPLYMAIQAANGSGKDKYFIAPCAVWQMLCCGMSRFVATTASHQQLGTQTEPYIRQLCESANAVFQNEVVQIKQQHYKVKFKEYAGKQSVDYSEIVLFVTDEAERAEGYHPWVPGTRLTLCANEAKYVPDAIFGAFHRCSGYGTWLEVSSPGNPEGHFYESCGKFASKEDEIPAQYFHRQITAFECGSIGLAFAQDLDERYGKDSKIYRSSVLAEFTFEDSGTVVSAEDLENAYRLRGDIQWIKKDLVIGFDSGVGGDLSVLTRRIGNKILPQDEFSCVGVIATAERADSILKGHGLSPSSYKGLIYADAGGSGAGVLDNLARLGWKNNIVRCFNHVPAYDNVRFANMAAEDWYRLKRFVEECCLILPPNCSSLLKQVKSRKWANYAGKSKLEDKKITKLRLGRSPDNADSLVLSLKGANVFDFKSSFIEYQERLRRIANPGPKQVTKFLDHESAKWAELDKELRPRKKSKSKSINRLINLIKK